MLLLTHLTVAFVGLLIGTLAFIKPSQSKIYSSYFLTGATIATGTALVIISNSPILKSCISGLVYVSVTSAMTYAARNKLAQSKNPN